MLLMKSWKVNEVCVDRVNMGCEYELLSYEEKKIVAVHYQLQDRTNNDVKFRSSWNYQEDFMTYSLVTEFFSYDKYIFVSMNNNKVTLSDIMPLVRSDVNDNNFLDFTKHLKWEPLFHPDSTPYYEHNCEMCSEGIPTKVSICLGCGYVIDMVDNEYYEDNIQIIQDHFKKLDYLNGISHMWSM